MIILSVIVLSIVAFVYSVSKQIKNALKEKNPYIIAHKNRDKNDKYYDDYINWMDKYSKSLPIEKIKSKEEKEFDRKVII